MYNRLQKLSFARKNLLFKMEKTILFLLIGCLTAFSLQAQGEKHLRNIKQLTWGGNNAEAYFSFDGKSLSFQSDLAQWGVACDQIFDLDIAKAAGDSAYRPKMISTGKGRTTCSFSICRAIKRYYMPRHISEEILVRHRRHPGLIKNTCGRFPRILISLLPIKKVR